MKARAVTVNLRVGAVADEGVADDVEFVATGELGHVEAETPRQSVDAVQHETEVVRRRTSEDNVPMQPFNAHIKTADQRTIILQHGDWYTGR